MFPAGTPGIALFLLRLASAAALLESDWRHPLFTSGAVTLVICGLLSVALCLGILTPYAATLSCLVELGLLIRSGTQPGLPVVISIMNTAALGLLGPGAYSLDSRIFGRRIISFPIRDRSEIP